MSLQAKPKISFWLLAAFLCLLFLTGGSTWASEPQLMLLRPAALVFAALGALNLSLQHFSRFRAVWMIFFAAVLLNAFHLVPLPFEIWSSLPGRDLIVAVDEGLGQAGIMRPLSMYPDATLNSLFALSVPLAVLLFAVQLSETEHQWILGILLGLVVLSGLIGIMQASGSRVAFYPLQTETAGLFANRNHQGVLLAMLVPLATATLCLPLQGKLRIAARTFLVAGLAVAVPLAIVTGSRSGIVAMAVGLVFAALSWNAGRAGRMQGLKAPIWPIAILGLGAASLVVMTVLVSRDVALDRLPDAGNDLRWPVWQSIIDMLPAYMPWGTGIGTYAEAYQLLEPDSLLRPTRSNHAHNELLEIALTAGLPGLALLTASGAALVTALWRSFAAQGAGNISAVLSRLGASLAALLALASITDYPVRTPILAAILALASVWASLGVRRHHETTSSQGVYEN